MGDVAPWEVSERALRRLARRCLASEGRLVEVLSSPLAMLRPVSDGSMSEALSGVVRDAARFLPGMVSAGEVSVGVSGLVSVPFECGSGPEGLMVAAALTDERGGVWVSAGGILVPGIGGDGEIDLEDMELLANRLNDICPVGCWGAVSDGLVLTGGVIAPLSEVSDERWLRQVASAAVDVVAYADVALRSLFDSSEPGPHPLSAFRWEEEVFLRSAGESFTDDDVDAAVESLLSGLPPLLASGVEVERSGGGVMLRVPSLSEGPDPSVTLLLSLSEQPEGSSIPSGVHLSAESPELLEESAAAEWVSRLNGYGGDDGSASPLVSRWQGGNWYHAPGPQGFRRLMFYAVVPDRLRGVADLGLILPGLVREVCHGSERVRFARRFTSMLSETGAGEHG